MKEVSVFLDLKSIHNLRDLKGIPTKDGRVIKEGSLLRCGHLGKATKEDLETLQAIPVSDVVDFRTSWEKQEMPDQIIAGSTYHELPMFDKSKLSSIQNAQEIQEVVAKNPIDAMAMVYSETLTNPHSIEQWKAFFKILLESKGAVLFHCTQGKDRTGLGAILIESLLGVDPAMIFDDYMQTNLYLEKQENADSKAVQSALHVDHFEQEGSVNPFLCVCPQYYQTAMKVIEDHWQNIDHYLEQVLGIDANMKKQIQDKFLK